MKHKLSEFYILVLITFSLSLATNPLFAQSESKREVLFSESETLMFFKSNEALKVGLHLLKNSESSEDKAKINFLIAKIHSVKGDYNNALTYLFEAKKDGKDPKVLADIRIYESKILRLLYLDKQSKMCLDAAEKIIANNNDTDVPVYKAKIVLEKSLAQLDRQNYKIASQILKNAAPDLQEVLSEHSDLAMWFAIIRGRIANGLGDYREARSSFDEAMSILKQKRSKDNFGKTHLLLGLSNTFFYQQNHKESLAALNEAFEISRPFENLYLNETIKKQMAINYIALNDRANYRQYNSEFLIIHTKIDRAEEESVNTAYNLFALNFEDQFQTAKANSLKKFYLVLFAALLLIGGFVMYWYKFKSKKKRLNEIIKYLEVTRKNTIIHNIDKKEEGKKTIIPQETEQLLLHKLKRFENSTRFTNNDISLAVLAGQFETNTKYLSEIINKHYQVNFNTYINKLRINFIVERLKSDPNFMNYKISYLAEVSGFSSHSSFATVFKSITGITPITFIDLLKRERDIMNQKNEDNENE